MNDCPAQADRTPLTDFLVLLLFTYRSDANIDFLSILNSLSYKISLMRDLITGMTLFFVIDVLYIMEYITINMPLVIAVVGLFIFIKMKWKF